MSRRIRWVSIAVAFAASCEEAQPPRDDAATPPIARNVRPPSCATREEAPLPDGNGGATCLRVGADADPPTREAPDLTGLPTPHVFVRGGAVGGDGSLASPLGAVTDALARVAGGGTVAILRGEVALAAPAVLPAGVALVGVGPSGGSTLLAARGRAAVVVPSGAARVIVRDLALRYGDGASQPADVALAIAAGASAAVRNVRIEGASDGVVVDGDLVAERLSVLRAARNGVVVQGEGAMSLRSLLVRDGGGEGVAARSAREGGPAGRVQVTEAAIVDNAGRGIELSGAAGPGRGVAECRLGGPVEARGDLDCFSRVSSQGNGLQAMAVLGARRVEVRWSSLSGTRVVDGTPDGDGLLLATGARVAIDPEERTMARMGAGSLLVANGRMGVLAYGGGVELELNGARVQSNGSVGVLVANNAVARSVSYSRIEDNVAVGLAVASSATIVAVQCNGIAGTRAGSIPTTTGASPMLGDGLSVANPPAELRIDDNRFDGNARAGVVLDQVRGVFTRNRGQGNQYGASVSRVTEFTDTANEFVRNTVADRVDNLVPVTAPRP